MRTRLRGFAIPFHRNFEEINLRMYVRREMPDGSFRRGVVFVKEIVPRRGISTVARRVYNEPYVTLPTRHLLDRDVPSAAYQWRYGARWNQMAVVGKGEPAEPVKDSEEAYFADHFRGYTKQRDGSTIEYEVVRPKWKMWQAAEARLDCDVAGLYGREYVPFLSGPPASAFLADGSEVVVRQGVKVSPLPLI